MHSRGIGSVGQNTARSSRAMGCCCKREDHREALCLMENRCANDENGNLNRDEFYAKMQLASIGIYDGEYFEMEYENWNLFQGQWLMVVGTLSDGIEDAGIAGGVVMNMIPAGPSEERHGSQCPAFAGTLASDISLSCRPRAAFFPRQSAFSRRLRAFFLHRAAFWEHFPAIAAPSLSCLSAHSDAPLHVRGSRRLAPAG